MHKNIIELDKWTNLSEFKEGRKLTEEELLKLKSIFFEYAYTIHLYDFNKIMFGPVIEDYNEPQVWGYITLENLNNIV